MLINVPLAITSAMLSDIITLLSSLPSKVWADRNDKFPWEEGFEEVFRYKQPLLDRNAEFKFREPANLCVFTSRQHLEENKPILYVVQDHDGDWQFVTGDLVTPEDRRVVVLEQMVFAR